MKLAITTVGMLLFIVAATIFLFARHADAQPNRDACFDELLIRWNEFATDANRHMHTFEAQPAKEAKTHARLDKEFAGVRAMACW